MSSISNFAVNIYIARTLGAVQYGAFGLAYVTYGFMLNASRGLATDPLLVRFSGTHPPIWRRAVASCTGTATVVGLVVGTCALGAAWLLSGTTSQAFLALGLTLPGLMLQDCWRYSFFALGRGSQAFLNDTIWTVTLLPALVLLRESGHADVFWFVFAWGATATAAAAIGSLQARVIPRLPRTWEWLWRHRDLGPRYLAEGTANSASTVLRNYGLGFLLGLGALGYIQAASTLMGPFMVIFFGMGLVTLPEAARILRRSPRHLPLFCMLVSAGLALTALAWGVVLLVAMPRGLGNLMLGPLWRTDLPAGAAEHDRRHGRVRAGGCRHRPARPRGREAEPARHDPQFGVLCRLRSGRSSRRRGHRDDDRCRGRIVGWRAAVLVAVACRPAGQGHAFRGTTRPFRAGGRAGRCRARSAIVSTSWDPSLPLGGFVVSRTAAQHSYAQGAEFPCSSGPGGGVVVNALLTRRDDADPAAAPCPGHVHATTWLARWSRLMHPRQRTHLRPGILLDRDGTIIMDHGYVGSVDRVEFIDGAPDAIARFNRAGIPVAVVTNQAGVARGLYGVDDVARVHQHIEAHLARYGAHVDLILYCPYHPAGVVEAYRSRQRGPQARAWHGQCGGLCAQP